MNNKEADVFRLKLTLQETEQDFHTEEDWDVLQKYGKVNHSISRTILVPSDTTLHCFHFMIQILFGFQHEHNHHFMLEENEMKQLVHDHIPEYCDLCGIYFQFPSFEIYDQDWDDDYQVGQSGKKWMQKKYLRPTKLPFYSESYFENQRMIRKWMKELPENKEIKLDEYEQRIFHVDSEYVSIDECPIEKLTKYTFEENGRALCEKLQLKQLFHSNTQPFKTEDIPFIQKIIQLQTDRFSHQQFKQYEKYTNEFLSYLRVHQDMNETESKEADKRRDMFKIHVNPELVYIPSITDKLVYCYDYGDGWKIDIQLLNAYTAFGKDLFIDEKDQQIEGSLLDKLLAVNEKNHPLCVEKDGLDVIDDVGGIRGYIDFLKDLYEGNEEKKEFNREWSNRQGWSGRDIHWKKIL